MQGSNYGAFFELFCRIAAQYTMSSMPEQNGVAERENRTLMDMAASMMSTCHLPESLFSEALRRAAYI